MAWLDLAPLPHDRWFRGEQIHIGSFEIMQDMDKLEWGIETSSWATWTWKHAQLKDDGTRVNGKLLNCNDSREVGGWGGEGRWHQNLVAPDSW